MSLYPTLEDMQVDKLVTAQQTAYAQLTASHQQQSPTGLPSYNQIANASGKELYPGLSDFMGLELTQQMIAENMPEYLNNQMMPASGGGIMSSYSSSNASTLSGMVAPLSGTSVGLQRAQVSHGIRELILCKGADKKVGLRAKDINKGVFVSVVVKDSPAAKAGLRFGDQILQINGTLVAGFSIDDVHKLLKKSSDNNISVVIRDRPFERTVTLHKDSLGYVGFQFDNGRIKTIVKDSSAARNGLLIDHQLLEINGQNVVGMKDSEIMKLINDGGRIITVTIMPSFIYDHMMKKMSSSFIRGIMDHSVSDF